MLLSAFRLRRIWRLGRQGFITTDKIGTYFICTFLQNRETLTVAIQWTRQFSCSFSPTSHNNGCLSIPNPRRCEHTHIVAGYFVAIKYLQQKKSIANEWDLDVKFYSTCGTVCVLLLDKTELKSFHLCPSVMERSGGGPPRRDECCALLL